MFQSIEKDQKGHPYVQEPGRDFRHRNNKITRIKWAFPMSLTSPTVGRGVAYIRTLWAANVGADKDRRQQATRESVNHAVASRTSGKTVVIAFRRHPTLSHMGDINSAPVPPDSVVLHRGFLLPAKYS